MAVPPQAQKVLSFCASRPRSVSLSSMPSIMVTARPHLRVSNLTRIRCCSLLISPQTQMSRGSPHMEQMSAMLLIHTLDKRALFKTNAFPIQMRPFVYPITPIHTHAFCEVSLINLDEKSLVCFFEISLA